MRCTVYAGDSVTLQSDSTIPQPSLAADQTATISYAWDLTGDGLFTDLVTSSAQTTLSWADLVDFGFGLKGGSGDHGLSYYPLGLQVTLTVKTFDPTVDLVPQITSIEQSEIYVPVTVIDPGPTVTSGGSSGASTTMSLGGDPYALDLAAVPDPTGDQLVTTEVTWGDSGSNEVPQDFAADLVPTHYYQSPGTYTVTANVVDQDGDSNAVPYTTTVKVVFDATSLSPGSAYAIDQGQGVSLVGAAAGSPGGFEWIVNGQNAGAGTAGAFNSQTESVSDSLNLTWAELKSLGVTGTPGQNSFIVELSATYAGAASPITSNPTILVVTDVGPTATITNSGPVDQGQAATVSLMASDPNDPTATLTYSYNFGSGLMAGGPTYTLPASLAPGSHVITGQISDGTITQTYTTTVVVIDLPPQLSLATGTNSMQVVSVGGTATVGGTFSNAGGAAVTFSASLGTVTQNAAAGTWSWSYTPAASAPEATVTITVTDAEGDMAQQSFGLLVQDVAPTGTFNVPASCNQGAAVSVSFTNVTDPSSAETAAGFSYFYNFGDGKGFVAGTATEPVPAAVVANSGTVTILARVVDADGSYTVYSGVLAVNDVAAQITSLAVTPTTFAIGQLVTVTGTFGVDPGVNDTHTVRIAWGDSNADLLSPGTTLAVTTGGAGYSNASGVKVTGGSGTGMTVQIATTRGAITGLLITNPGTGYKPGDVLTVDQSSGADNAKLLVVGVLNASTRTFSAVHTYASQTVSNPVSITVTVADNNGGQAQESLTAIAKGAPTVLTWSNPVAITYGTALSSTQLNASAGVPGSFVYNPPAGTVLHAGTNQTLSVRFTPTDTVDYLPATTTVSITVSKATPRITWTAPAPVAAGETLSGTQLDATSSVAGTFVYTPAPGTVLKVGNNQKLSVTFTPTDATDYTSASDTVTISVAQATPTITWANPANILLGTALGATQLDATASVPGQFTYSPVAGTVLAAGSQTLSVTFAATDATDYTDASDTVTIYVALTTQTTPTITWANPASITFGTALGDSQLDATASVPGQFTYSRVAGTVLGAGNQALSVIFTPTDTTDYANASDTVTISVARATPIITWATPTSITHGTPLGASQLNATASVPGTFVYSSVAGTILGVGNQTLSVTFTPADSIDYNNASDSVTIKVAQGTQSTPTITWANPGPITYGTPLGALQLDATASVPGQFYYSSVAGTVLRAGNQALKVIFTPTDSIDYTNASDTVTIKVAQATPTITWANPAAIASGTALGASQLDAAANVPGRFTYSPAAGTLLGAGNQTLSVTFTPTDPTDYSSASHKVTVNVEPPPPPAPVTIIGEQAVFTRKLKKGKPVGKAVLTGYMLDFGAPLNPTAAANRANYQVATMTTKKVKKKVTHILKPISNFTVSYVPAKDAVEVMFTGAETFPTGGQITVSTGVTSANGGALAGTTMFTISPKGNNISPG